MIWSLVSFALAGSGPPARADHPPSPRLGTTGYRATTPAGPPATQSRLAFVADPDGLFVGELTLRGQVGWRWFGMAAEVAGTAGASDTWSSAGAGNAVVDLRVLFGGTVTNALGFRVTLPVGQRWGPLGPVSWWGTVPSATVPSPGIALAWEGATPRWVWHVHAGVRFGSSYSTAFEVVPLDLQANVATVQPVGGAWSAVVELEMLNEQSPFHVRGLARADLGHGWTADVGLAVPFAVFFDDPTLQVIGAARRTW